MPRPELEERLSRISTFWSAVHVAHEDPPDARQAAQNLLLERYSGAAYRYLLGAVRDPDVAAELFQDFAPALPARRFPACRPAPRPLSRLRQDRPHPPGH